jgi:hypothetical protein
MTTRGLKNFYGIIGGTISHGNGLSSLIFISKQIVSAVLGSFGITNVLNGGEGIDVRVNLLSTSGN